MDKKARDIFIYPLTPPCVIWWHFRNLPGPPPKVSRIILMTPKEIRYIRNFSNRIFV